MVAVVVVVAVAPPFYPVSLTMSCSLPTWLCITPPLSLALEEEEQQQCSKLHLWL